VVVQPTGHKSFHVRLWFRGKGYNVTLGSVLDAPATATEPVIGTPLTLADARVLASHCLRRVKTGTHPSALTRPKTSDDSVQSIGAEYMRREGLKLRSAASRQYDLDLICKSLGTHLIADVKLSDVVRLRDRIEENHGPMAARRALASWQAIASWHAGRTDDFRPPLIRGLKIKPNIRSRVLTDEELRTIWKTAGAFHGPFGRYVQFILLTATRRNEALDMRRSELVGPDTWVIPAERYKTKRDLLVPLSRAAQGVINAIPVILPGDFVFTNDGRRAMGGLVRPKKALDAASGVTGWVIHDLRRTARTLMSRAGVEADIAERCLGHVIGGVRATYDRHEFDREKRNAFEALATMIDTIVRGDSRKAVSFPHR
jgi:integrase